MCKICEIISKKKSAKILYEDAAVMAVLADEPTIFSHVWVFPKKHYKTLEEIPDNIVQQLFSVASNAATAVFEGIGAQGTNIIICNGDNSSQKFPHLVIDVLPRKENDGLNFQWEPKKLSPEDMENAKERINERIGLPAETKQEKGEPGQTKLQKPSKEELVYEGEDNYLVKSLKRVP